MAGPYSAEPVSSRIVSEARAWIGTPYVHQASLRGIGTDCLGLVRGVWRSLVGPEPERMAAYSPDWAEASGDEQLLCGLKKHLRPIEFSDLEAGDVLAFRMLERGPVKHLAILTSIPSTLAVATMIHAYSGRSVCETTIGQAWGRRLVTSFRFPQG